MTDRTPQDKPALSRPGGLLSQVHWYAVHTRSRHEKLVHRQLEAAQVESFLPLRRDRRRWKYRHKWVDFPMFPGYLFVRGDGEALDLVYETRGVLRVLGNGRERPSPVDEDQIERVQIVVGSRVPVEPYPCLKEGTLVRVLRGALMGLVGILVQRRNLDRIVIKVDLIGKAVAAEIDASNVEPV